MTKVAIIGFGSRGRMFGQLISEDKEVELVAVADVVEEQQHGAENFDHRR